MRKSKLLKIKLQSSKALSILILLVIALSACSPAPPLAPPAPTQAALVVALPPALRPLGPVLQRCAQTDPGLALFLIEVPEADLLKTGDLAFSLGLPDPAPGFASLLTEEALVPVVNPANPVFRLSMGEIRALYTGQAVQWSEVGGADENVAVWVYPQAQALQTALEDSYLEGRSASSQAWLAPDPTAMREAISEDPFALGALPSAWLTKDVRTVQLDGSLPASARLPVLAIAPAKPQGHTRDLLLCLQSKPGQTWLESVFPGPPSE